MQGLGNDFMVIDAINQPVDLSSEQIKALADRHFGIGFDQLLLVEKPVRENADFKYRIFNADGSEVAQCGNGARCFARFVRDQNLSTKNSLIVDTLAGQLVLTFVNDALITVNMGVPRHEPGEIPMSTTKAATLYQVTVGENIINFAALSIGNPHAVIQVENVDTAPVDTVGAELERHPLFPERANIGFMQIVDRGNIRLRVFERGAGETLACGSGACAAVVAGIEQNLLDENVQVSLPGGKLAVSWKGRGQSVYMSGSATLVYEGQIKL